jgi:hypothetical protein
MLLEEDVIYSNTLKWCMRLSGLFHSGNNVIKMVLQFYTSIPKQSPYLVQNLLVHFQ